MKSKNKYYAKRPYRCQSVDSNFFLPFMEERFEQPFSGKWEQFGYEIGGPVCYAYARWIADELSRDTDVSGIAFVARDGYLLQKIYELLPVSRKINTNYVYATRSVAAACKAEKGRNAFQSHIAPLEFGNGTVAVVDTVTMKYTSQRLLESELGRKTRGYFWTVLRSGLDYKGNLDCRVFQTEPYHLIRCWNLVEFIITSPEPPIEGISEAGAIYQAEAPQELARESAFAEMEKGILSFIEDVCTEGKFPVMESHEIAAWVNEYLKHPSEEDIKLFQPIYFTEDEYHSDYIPLDPFFRKTPAKALKDRLWLFSQRHKVLYFVLHQINVIFKGRK